MKRIKNTVIITTAFCLTIAGISATKIKPPVPDYYINNVGVCVEGPDTTCPPGPPCNCIINIPGEGLKQMYDTRVNGQCVNCLRLLDK